ncbi:molybdopterin-dependent oxidoreductase [Halorientalis halophila]|uniref:molybdopterin-dependent oxidoreductase n=1 Tax=Halorientalis halophila TaxID=3108499 RepID=UPI00300BB90D
MTRIRDRFGDALPTLLVGLCAGLTAVVGSYAAAGFTPAFVLSPITAWLTATIPNAVTNTVIETLGSLGQQLNLATAVALTVTAVGALAVAALVVGRRLRNRALPVVLTGVGTWGFVAVATGEPLLALGAALPPAVVVLVAVAAPSLSASRPVDSRRRQLLAGSLSLVGFALGGYAVGQRRTPTLGGESLDPSDRRERLLAAAEAQSFSLEGAEPLVSDNFYTVDVANVDPTLDESDWTLTITGEVAEEVTLDYEDLTAMESVDRFETLRCVGESLNGQKMDTALWTGAPLRDLVERAGPKGDCECVRLRAADDYYQVFPIDALEDSLLAYGMNGDALPRGHGYPVRALIPGHWGEIQVKWLTEIEVLDRDADGYWEERGWHGTGPVETVAKLHSVSDLADGRKQVGGHAYAGTRGIDRVEVSTDGGSTWNEAELTDPLEGISVWRQWRYRYDPPSGEHEVVVRAIDGEGNRQPREERDAFPSGATGWVSRTVA